MALPSLQQITGSHSAVYEAYFKQANPSGTGTINALDAATFLKKSGLDQKQLGQIWDLSDSSGKGYLDRTGFFVALKLIALAQVGGDVSVTGLAQVLPAPNMGPVAVEEFGDWAIPESERAKYYQIFDGLQPQSGLLSGDKVKPVLMNSNLPVDTLGKVWELADIDNDGMLDRHEFCVAMHLVYRALEKEPVPTTLPTPMIPPSKRRAAAAAALSNTSLDTPAPAVGSVPQPDAVWVVSQQDKVKYDQMFASIDHDKDGFVLGGECKDIFLQAGLPQNTLAHIWNLCDTNGIGKLNCDQFALAMYLISQVVLGKEVPVQLSPEMMPPSMRETSGGAAAFKPSKELEQIEKEIEALKKEKIRCEADRVQKEADLRIRSGEVATLQRELDAVNNTFTQLETQKGEAQKRLDDLNDKKEKLLNNVKELKDNCLEEQRAIENMKSMLVNREHTIQNQAVELQRLNEDLAGLRKQERDLEDKVRSSRSNLEQMDQSLVKIRTEISQAHTQVTSLGGSPLTNGDVSNLSASAPHTEADSFNFKLGGSPVSTLSGGVSSGMEDVSFKDDIFRNKDPFSNTASQNTLVSSSQKNVFGSDDPFKQGSSTSSGFGAFKDDPFAANDPFAGSDPFGNNAAKSTDASGSNFKSDPFRDSVFGGDFGGVGVATAAASGGNSGDDPFAPQTTANYANTAAANAVSAFDAAFPADPFAPQPPSSGSPRAKTKSPAPPRPSTSPLPRLPPKEGTKRLAPSRPPPPSSSPRASPAIPDPFGQDLFGGGTSFGSSAKTGDDASWASGFDAFGSTSQPASSESPLTWATRESAESAALDKARREQEQKDLELALRLSRQENAGSSDA